MNITIETLLSGLAFLLYAAGLIPLLRALLSGGTWGDLPLLSRWLTAAAITVHAALLYLLIAREHGPHIGIAEAASLFLWQCALLIWLSSFRWPLGYLFLAMMPATAIASLGALATESKPDPHSPLTWIIVLHIVLSMLAYGLLTIAAVQGLVLALQDRLLRNHEPQDWLRQLPPLQSMERILFQFMAGGFFLLSLTLLSGFFFVEDIFAQHLAHKTALSLFAWLVFGILLWGRWRFGWRGKTAIRWTLGGYCSLLLAYFGSKVVLEVLLGTGWQ